VLMSPRATTTSCRGPGLAGNGRRLLDILGRRDGQSAAGRFACENAFVGRRRMLQHRGKRAAVLRPHQDSQFRGIEAGAFSGQSRRGADRG